jgi:beta-barrel assembly-enhancing protease
MSARSLRCVVAGLGALALSCASVKHLSSIPGVDGGLIQAADTVMDVVGEASECEKLKAAPSVEEEYALGGAVALNWVQRGGGLLGSNAEEKLVRYINVVGRNLGAQSPRPTLRWTFGVLRTVESFNAVSSPGGYVFVTLGLLRGVENEAQLAGVLAHEIAHITSKHALARYSEVKVSQCQIAVAVKTGKKLSHQSSLHLTPKAVDDLLALLKGSDGTVELDQHVELLDGLTEASMEALVEKGFGKEDEFAADEEAVRMLMSAGYDPREYIEFLGKIPDSRGSFSNHPRKADRVKRLVALLEDARRPGEGFPDLAANPEQWVQPPLPPEFAAVKGTVARDKP